MQKEVHLLNKLHKETECMVRPNRSYILSCSLFSDHCDGISVMEKKKIISTEKYLLSSNNIRISLKFLCYR